MSQDTPALDSLTVASPCPESWDAMPGDDRRRYCGRCRLPVQPIIDWISPPQMVGDIGPPPGSGQVPPWPLNSTPKATGTRAATSRWLLGRVAGRRKSLTEGLRRLGERRCGSVRLVEELFRDFASAASAIFVDVTIKPTMAMVCELKRPLYFASAFASAIWVFASAVCVLRPQFRILRPQGLVLQRLKRL